MIRKLVNKKITIKRYQTVTITISCFNHLIQLFFTQPFTKIFHCSPQLVPVDNAIPVSIKHLICIISPSNFLNKIKQIQTRKAASISSVFDRLFTECILIKSTNSPNSICPSRSTTIIQLNKILHKYWLIFILSVSALAIISSNWESDGNSPRLWNTLNNSSLSMNPLPLLSNSSKASL